MSNFPIFKDRKTAEFFLEEAAPNGVKRVAGTVCNDICHVTGSLPSMIEDIAQAREENLIFAGTLGHSDFACRLEKEGLADFSALRGRRECYLMKIIEAPFSASVKKLLVIVGSDKRGSIYGLFRLSELCGVSPLIYWGDVMPEQKDEVILSIINEIQSKEPSVKYRGFFINDEWPAFGKWCMEHFGGVNAKAYEKVFELLLRLKGNYLWPAMWRSSFWEDGPGLENAKLADEYGVIMGTSHHEPLCRAGVEWQNQYAQYGEDNTWSFITNSAAITEFWRDGLKRSKAFENIITVGMRGENDSLLLSKDATLQDNIDVVKKALRAQNRLLREEINEDLQKIPRMFAVYKEVEDFYFGSGEFDGLKDAPELEGAIMLLSDDNHGNLRAIPQKGEPLPKGGYGLYYHFDYHGAPFSYEWLNHTNPAKAWEQLTMAYEHDIREMWIVNVGDIKGNEYPLSYFMALAYDYDKWGISNLNSASEYTEQWISVQFPAASPVQKDTIHKILDAYTGLTTLHIPESMNAQVFQNNFHELQRMESFLTELEKMTASIRSELPKPALSPYDSTIYYPVMASSNSFFLNLTAGQNHLLAKRGVLSANSLLPALEARIQADADHVAGFHALLGGKWNHMMESAHTGFRTWDDNNWTYPLLLTVPPIPYGKITISFRGDDACNLGLHWQDRAPIRNEEMMRPDVDAILLDIDSRGRIDFDYTLHCDAKWLHLSQTAGHSELTRQPRTTITISCDRALFAGKQKALIRMDFLFENGEKGRAVAEIWAANEDYSSCSGAFLETEGYLCIGAENFSRQTDVDGMGWRVVPRLGRTSGAIKSFPVTKCWKKEEKRPYVEYRFVAATEGEYTLSFYFSPRNPGEKGGMIESAYGLNGEEAVPLFLVPDDYYAEWYCPCWSQGVTENIRVVTQKVTLKSGLNTLQLYAADPTVILEKIVFYNAAYPVKKTYLAPPESYRLS